MYRMIGLSPAGLAMPSPNQKRTCDRINISFEGIARSLLPFGLLHKFVIVIAAAPAFFRGTPVSEKHHTLTPNPYSPPLGSIRATLVCIHSGECPYTLLRASPFHLNIQTPTNTHSTMLLLHMGRSGIYLFIHPFPMFMCSPALPTATAILPRISLVHASPRATGGILHSAGTSYTQES